MADEIKKENEENEEFENPVEKAIIENYTQNEDLVDYIHEDSLAKLMSKYAEAEEDESIRENWNEPAQTKTDMEKGQTSKFTSYYYSPDEIRKDAIPDATPGLADSFDKATSAYDNDRILFGDIDLDSKSSPEDAPVPMSQLGAKKPQIEVIDNSHPAKLDEIESVDSELPQEPEKPAPKRRGRPPKAKPETGDEPEKPAPKKRGRPPKAKSETGDEPVKPAPKKRGRPPKAKPAQEEQEKNPMVVERVIEGEKRDGRYSISDKYYTNTRVVFTDDGLNDGIRRHTEDEVSGAFSKPKKKRRGLFGRWK